MVIDLVRLDLIRLVASSALANFGCSWTVSRKLYLPSSGLIYLDELCNLISVINGAEEKDFLLTTTLSKFLSNILTSPAFQLIVDPNAVMRKLHDRNICEPLQQQPQSSLTATWKITKTDCIDLLNLSIRRVVYRRESSTTSDPALDAFLKLITMAKVEFDYDKSIMVTFDEKSERKEAWEVLKQVFLT
jgi:hypothetical protein